MQVIARNSFTIEGLVSNMTATEWDPIFGVFHAQSSRGDG